MNRKKWFSFLLASIFILSLSILSACNAAATDNSGDRGTDAGYNGAPSKTSSSAASGAQENNAALTGRKVIFTALLNVETTDFENSVAVLEKMIADYEGYVQESDVETGTSYWNSSKLRTATYKIRIPSESLEAFLADSGDIGNIIRNSKTGEDVTDQYYDTKAHIEALQTQEDRLLELLKSASVLSDIISLEDRLSQVRYEIEQLTGTLNELSSLADLSTVTVEISEVESITLTPEGFWGQVQNTFDKSLKALVDTLRVLSLVLIAIAPFIVVFGLIALMIVLIIRRATRKKRLARKAQQAAAQANYQAYLQQQNAQRTAAAYVPPAAPPAAPAVPANQSDENNASEPKEE